MADGPVAPVGAELADGAGSGEFRLVDPTLTAIAIGGLGMQVAHWFAPGDPYTSEQVADAYVHLALRMAGYITSTTEADNVGSDE